jgi:hypothetical protein
LLKQQQQQVSGCRSRALIEQQGNDDCMGKGQQLQQVRMLKQVAAAAAGLWQ